MPTLLLTRKDVRGLLDMAEVIEAVEQAFRCWEDGRAAMPAKAYLVLEQGDIRAMPSSIPGGAAVKWANVHTGNPSRGLPTVMAVLIYSDPETGYPLAVMDATEITAYRTGATAAIASRYLARKGSRTLGIIGAGQQAYTQLAAHAKLFDLGLVKVHDRSSAAAARFIESFPDRSIRSCSAEEASASDIVCTLTPAREPFLKRDWIMPGTHINAVGADADGKEELEPSILKDAVVVVDDMRQSTAGGEINVPLKKGIITVEDIYGTLGEIIAGKKPGRTDEESITVFDSTGLAIEDVAVASIIYRKAQQRGGYLSLDLVEG
jgi:alanine dehydrogenase